MLFFIIEHEFSFLLQITTWLQMNNGILPYKTKEYCCYSYLFVLFSIIAPLKLMLVHFPLALNLQSQKFLMNQYLEMAQVQGHTESKMTCSPFRTASLHAVNKVIATLFCMLPKKMALLVTMLVFSTQKTVASFTGILREHSNFILHSGNMQFKFAVSSCASEARYNFNSGRPHSPCW